MLRASIVAVVALATVSTAWAAPPTNPSALAGWWTVKTPPSQCSLQKFKMADDGLSVKSLNLCGVGAQVFDINFVWSSFTANADGSLTGNATEVFMSSGGQYAKPPSQLLTLALYVSPDGKTLRADIPSLGAADFEREQASAYAMAGAYSGQGANSGSSAPSFDVYMNVDGPLATAVTAEPGGTPAASYVVVQEWDMASNGVTQTFLEGDVTAGTVQYCSFPSPPTSAGVKLYCCAPGECSTFPGANNGTLVSLSSAF